MALHSMWAVSHHAMGTHEVPIVGEEHAELPHEGEEEGKAPRGSDSILYPRRSPARNCPILIKFTRDITSALSEVHQRGSEMGLVGRVV